MITSTAKFAREVKFPAPAHGLQQSRRVENIVRQQKAVNRSGFPFCSQLFYAFFYSLTFSD